MKRLYLFAPLVFASLLYSASGETTSGSFAGQWRIYFYDVKPADFNRGSKPTHVATWNVQVRNHVAETRDSIGRKIKGPVSKNGRTWHAKLVMNDVIVQEFRQLQLSSDNKTFKGQWGGAEWHGYLIRGERRATRLIR